MKKAVLEFVLYHISKRIPLENIREIRDVRVLKHERLKNIRKNLPYKILFYDNDLITFKDNGIPESHLDFYIVKSNGKCYLLGIEIQFFDNRTKNEDIIYFEKIGILMSMLLSSKYNMIIYP